MVCAQFSHLVHFVHVLACQEVQSVEVGCPMRRRMKAYDEVAPSRGLVQHGGPRVIRPIVTGPAWLLRITGLFCKGFPVITVCNPALWEYSGDNLGA